MGVFLSVDPVTAYGNGDMRFFNRYAYAYNNPYAFTDPDGRCPTCAARGAQLEFELVFWLATRAGAATFGAWLGNEIYDISHRNESSEVESSEPGEVAPEPGTAESDEGCIYCVSGENTSSGKDYIGSTDDLDNRSRDSSDGRDRRGAEKVDSYKKGDRADRQNKEQKAMNERGGKDNLDNKRNEVAPRKWEGRGIEPPVQ